MRWLLAVAVAGCSFRAGQAPGGATIDSASGDAMGDAPARSWWNPSWPSRLPLTIANASTDALAAGYQVALVRDVAGAPCTGDLDDMRVTFGTTELTRVIDSVGPPQYTWFALAAPLAAGATSTGEYWLYCGNATPGAAPADSSQVFDFYDGFDTLDLTQWTKLNNATASGGSVTIGKVSGGTNDNGIATTMMFASKHAVDFAATSGATMNTFWWAGFQRTKDNAPWVIWYSHNGAAIAPSFKTDGGEWDGTDTPLDTSAHVYGVENYGDHAMYRYQDAPRETHVYAPDGLPPATMPIRAWNYTNNTTVTFDWLRVRQAVDPPPAVTAGAAETY